MRKVLMSLALVMIFASPTLALVDQDISVPYQAMAGTATVDGDLSDWAGANWVELDVADFATDGLDSISISSAKYCVRWDDASNLVFVAAEVVDTDLLLADEYLAWNLQDDLEVYIDAGENNNDRNDPDNPHDYSANGQDLAQQFAIGVMASDNNASWIWGGAAPTVVAAHGGKLVGNTLTYELALNPLSYFGGLKDPVEPDVTVDLTAGETIGLDVMVNTWDGIESAPPPWNPEGDPLPVIHNATNNAVGAKFRNGSAFQTWELVGGEDNCQTVNAAVGDFNCDGEVDLTDLVTLGENYNTAGDHTMGDTNADGIIDLTDLVTLGENYNTTVSTPEPASLGLLLVGSLLAIRRR